MGVTGIIMMMGNIKVIMKILILVDEITELMMIETVIAQEEVMIRSNISNMRCSVSSPDERPRRELKIRRAAEYF